MYWAWKLIAAALLSGLAAGVLQGQPVRRGFAVQGDAGVLRFAEYRSHGAAGGSVRLPFSRRWAFQPEFNYLWAGRGHDDFILLPNFNFDFTSPPSRTRPYVKFGFGMIRTRETGPGWRFSSNSWHLSGGGGVKVFVADRWFVAPDFRIGGEPHVRFTFGIGYEFR